MVTANKNISNFLWTHKKKKLNSFNTFCLCLNFKSTEQKYTLMQELSQHFILIRNKQNIKIHMKKYFLWFSLDKNIRETKINFNFFLFTFCISYIFLFTWLWKFTETPPYSKLLAKWKCSVLSNSSYRFLFDKTYNFPLF